MYIQNGLTVEGSATYQVGTVSFQGTTTAVTAPSGDNTTNVATTAFVHGAVNPPSGVTAGTYSFASVVVNTTGQITNAVAGWNSLNYLPLAFGFSGKPAANQNAVCVISAYALVSIPTSFMGGYARAATAPTSSATFALSAISVGGTVTNIGNVIVNTSGAGTASGFTSVYNASAGDILKITAPATQDATMADVAITILATRTN